MTTAAKEAPVAKEPAAAGRRQVLLLGPQRREPNLAAELDAHGIDGPVAVVTSGWQEREDEVEELQEHLGGRTRPLRLHARALDAFESDGDLAGKHRERQEILRRMQRLYDVRLTHAMAAVAELDARPGEDDTLLESREAALKAVGDLDREHLLDIREVHERFAQPLDLANRKAIARHREEVAEIVRDSAALAIAGGHVAVLLNRLRLFDVVGALRQRQPVIGWSAGAMVLTERVVLYHDSPPQGAGNAELLEGGLGLVRNLVALPHAQRRLRLDDPERVSRLARRMAPRLCLALDDGGAVALESRGITSAAGVRTLDVDGTVREMSR
ncbi:Type 1 glutamine amidotransferase-like domain-containing protein [bacterium]|nr:Type 1 glutamine amidotransferase-like domain-containing protein [bacterium]